MEYSGSSSPTPLIENHYYFVAFKYSQSVLELDKRRIKQDTRDYIPSSYFEEFTFLSELSQRNLRFRTLRIEDLHRPVPLNLLNWMRESSPEFLEGYNYQEKTEQESALVDLLKE